jgi:gamma-glutamyl-gamma-aminobutyrate hydrolase PuuD
MDYIEFVRIAGYMPFMVCVGMDVDEIANSMDGLLLTGGKDISPYMYGEDLGWNGATKCNLRRDLFERDLYDAFVARGKPVFGICRGFQLIVIFAAGDKLPMSQDINKLKTVTQLHQQSSAEITGDNPVHSIECRGVLRKLIGNELLGVNSFHHQGFVLAGKTTDSSWLRQNEDIFCWARSRDTALILEAFGMFVEDEDGNDVKVAGVQYHPERMMRREEDREHHLKLFQYTMGTLECEWAASPPQITGTTVTHHRSAGPLSGIRQDFNRLRK